MIIIKKLLLLGALGASVLGVNAQKAKAATVNQNANTTTVKRKVNSNCGVSVFSNYQNAGYTGGLLKKGDEVNVYDTKTDLAGNKWIKIGQGKWIMEQYTVPSSSTSQSSSAQYRSKSTGQSSSAQYRSSSTGQSSSAQYGAGLTSQSSSAPYRAGSTGQSSSAPYGTTSQSSSAQYRSGLTSQSSSAVAYQYSRRSTQTQNLPAANDSSSQSENLAKEWIAQRESGGSYTAQNGQYYGRYQLSRSYLNGDYSIENQERVANNYVKNRYGSWSNAKNFWQTHGWY